MKQNSAVRVVRIALGTACCALLFFITMMIVPAMIHGIFAVNSGGTLGLTVVTELPVSSDKKAKENAVQIVFVTGEASGTLNHVFLTVIDCKKVSLRFMEIPSDTRLTLSTALYQKMILVNASVPQITSLSSLYGYFESARAYDMVLEALEEILPVRPDYYTIMPEQVYLQFINESMKSSTYTDFLREDLMEQVRKSGGMKAYLCSIWEQCESDLSVSEKMFYLETYEGLSNRSISYCIIPGESHNNGYIISVEKDFFNYGD